MMEQKVREEKRMEFVENTLQVCKRKDNKECLRLQCHHHKGRMRSEQRCERQLSKSTGRTLSCLANSRRASQASWARPFATCKLKVARTWKACTICCTRIRRWQVHTIKHCCRRSRHLAAGQVHPVLQVLQVYEEHKACREQLAK